MTDTGIAGSITSDKGNGTGRGARKTKVEGSSIKGAEGFQFAKGGSGGDNTMFTRGKDGAGKANPAEAGTSSPGTSGGGDWAKGGSGRMASEHQANTARPGVVSTD